MFTLNFFLPCENAFSNNNFVVFVVQAKNFALNRSEVQKCLYCVGSEKYATKLFAIRSHTCLKLLREKNGRKF